MGDGQSVPENPEDGAKSKKSQKGNGGVGRPSAEQMNDNYKAQNTDGKAAIEAAFAGDSIALEEIRKIVAQLEGLEAPDLEDDPLKKAAKNVERERLIQQAKTTERQRAQKEQATHQQADDKADDWLERQLREGLVAEAAALRKQAAKQEADSLAQAAEEARLVAKTEAAARAALYEKAEIAEQERLIAAPKGIVMSARGVRVTVAIREPGSDPQVPEQPPEEEAEEQKKEKPVTIPEFYKMLDIKVDATFDEIKKGYRKQALKWHPDKNQDNVEVATERFKKITEAFDTLFDPQRRNKYDSGAVQLKGKMMKLQGAGWSNLPDEHDDVLTTQGWKWKRQAWRGYVMLYGRIDDDPDQIVQDDNDPRAPAVKLKVFWRLMGEMAYTDREDPDGEEQWLYEFVKKVWKDTPNRWPKALELKGMNDAGQQEWKERRMVYHRRKEKMIIAVDLHDEYLAIPNRKKKEMERLIKRNPIFADNFGIDDGTGRNKYQPGRPERNAHLMNAPAF